MVDSNIPGSPTPTHHFLIGGFPKHHFSSRDLSSSKRNHHFFNITDRGRLVSCCGKISLQQSKKLQSIFCWNLMAIHVFEWLAINWMIQNLYLGNGCLTGSLEFQAIIPSILHRIVADGRFPKSTLKNVVSCPVPQKSFRMSGLGCQLS